MGARLRKLRTDRGETLIEVADAAGLNGHSFLSNLETGKKVDLTLSTFVALADHLGASLDYLYRGAATNSPQVPGKGPHTEQEIALLELWRELDVDKRAFLLSLLERGIRPDAA